MLPVEEAAELFLWVGPGQQLASPVAHNTVLAALAELQPKTHF